MFRFSIKSKDFLRGASNTDNSLDGGFSPDGKGHNIKYKDGLLAPPPEIETVDNSALAAGENAFAIQVQNDAGSFDDDLIVTRDGSENGSFYRIDVENSNDIDELSGSPVSSESYNKETSDAISYKSNLYVSAEGDITFIDSLDNSPGIDPDWGTTVAGFSALNNANHVHHFFQFDDNLFFTNSDVISKWDGSTATDDFCRVSTGEKAITAVEVHNNLVYIATEYFYAYTTTATTKLGTDRLYIWDGVNSDNVFQKILPLPGKVYSMRSYKGLLLLFFKDYVAYFNGIRFIKLRDLSSAVYKHHITEYKDNLYIAEGSDILVFDGQKWFYILSHSNTIDAIGVTQGDKLYFVSNTDIFKSDLDDFDNNGQWYSDWYEFGDKVYIRRIKLILDEDMASGDVNTLKLTNEEKDTVYTFTASFALHGATKIVDKRLNIKASSLRFDLDNFDNLIKEIVIYGERTNEPN